MVVIVILAIDTSVGVSVALHDGSTICCERNISAHAVQGEMCAALVREVVVESGCAMADISHIVVGVGPGPFTGLRVGIATAVAIGLALRVPVTGVCSLDAVALDAAAADIAAGVAITDARRGEVYCLSFGQPGAQPEVLSPDQARTRFGDGPYVGPAVALYPDSLPGTALPLRAAALATIAATGQLHERPLTPLYLRAPDAQVSSQRKTVLS